MVSRNDTSHCHLCLILTDVSGTAPAAEEDFFVAESRPDIETLFPVVGALVAWWTVAAVRAFSVTAPAIRTAGGVSCSQ